MFGATPASSGFTFPPSATTGVAASPPPESMAKELLESIKKAASIDQAFQAMHGNAAQKAAFLELRPLHALVRSPPITGSFNATMAEKVLSFFANQTPPIIEQESAEHYTPLMQACVHGDLDAVRFFLDKGADINKEVSWQNTGWFVTRESHTPLRLACKHAQVALTQLLLERGADATKIDTFFSILRNTALSHADKMALGMALLPYTNLTNHWAQLLVDLLNSRALPLFQKLLTLDDKIKEWKFLPNTSQDPLIQLIEAGGEALPEWIDELLRNGHKFDPPIDVNATRSSNGTPVVLLSVVRSRSAAVIKTLIKHGADPNARDESGQVPLLSACTKSQDIIDELLAAGADIFAVDPDGRTALHAALRYGLDALALSFIEKGVDTNARDASGNTALGYALVYERWDAVDRLLTDANLDEPIQWLLRRPILRSDKEEKDRDRARLIQKRLAAGKKPPRRNYEQENELYELVDDHATCSVKAQEYQRLAGVNSKMLDVRGKTPLLFCVAAGRTALVKRILARRPELSWQTCNIAADWPGLASRYEGMRVDISPAALAALHGQAKAFGLLFKHADGHLDVNAWMEWDRMRQQCIHAFLKDQPGDEDALQALSVLASLGQPVEVNNRDKRGRTPLHHAAYYQLPWCVWRLLQMGADPLVVDNWGNSPLALAAHAREWDICRQLISAGANINAFYQPPRKGSSPREHKQSLIGILARGIPVEVLMAIADGQQVAPEHMYELITSSHFDFVYHLLKKLRAENKLQSYLSAQQCKGPLFALTKLKISDSRSKPAQKVLKALFAAVKDYGCTARNERGDTFLTALAREQQTDADSAEDSAKMSQTEFASLTLALIAHGADLAERNVDGDTFFHVVARDYQSTELLKSFLAAIDAERAQRLAQPQTSTSTMAAAAAAAEAQKMEGVEGGEADMDVEFEAAAAATKPESAAAAGEEEKNKLAAQPEEGSLEARVKRALEVRNGRGQTPLLTAVRPYAHAACRNTEVMGLLLALGANPQDREQGTGNTALFYAVMTDNQAGVRKLLELGLDINGVNDKGETPLFVAGRQNLWKMTLFLLLSGANPHAINEAGECVLLASSGFCAAIIHDFVARPRSLSFIVSALFPELVAGLPNHRPAASPTEGATSTSAANEPAIASTTTPTPLPAAMTSSSSSLPQVSITDPGNSSESAKSEDDSKAKEEKNEKGNENEEEQEAEEASKTLLDNFPEILHQLNDGDTTTAGGPASGDGLRKREQNKRQRMNAAVKQVTELLRRVLDALQLYEGALDEADVAPDSGSSGDQGDEQHRRARWERNASLTRLKEQLAGWLRKSEARIPRITRNLSFTTLSEGEMALYLRQWKSLRRQRNQRKRKRGEEVEEDFFAETSSQPQEEWIDVKRPRLEGQGQGEDSDGGDLPMPPLTVPEVESIPLPPPFVLFDDAVPFDALAPLLIRRTRSLVVADAKSAIPDESNSGASYKAPDEDDDDVDDSVDLDDNADKTGVDTGVGLLAEEGYLLDAFLTKVDDVEQSAKLQALFVRSKVTMVNVDTKGRDDEAEKTTVMDVESTDNKSEAKEKEKEKEKETEMEESEKEKENGEWRCGFFVWDSIEGIEEFDTREAAIAEFKRRFAKFTGHAWDDRAHFRHNRDHDKEDEAPTVDNNTNDNDDKAPEAAAVGQQQQESSAMAVDDVDKEKAKEQKEEEKENEQKQKEEEEEKSGGYCYLPTDHRAVLRHRRYSKLYGDEEEEGSEDEGQEEDDDLGEDEESDGEEESLRAKQKKEPSADKRLYDMLAFISHKKRLWSFCNRVGLFEITGMGQLTSTQIKNAYRILNVLSGILTYKKEMEARKREVPEKVSQAIGELSNQFHRVLPFNFSGNNLSLNINKRKILAEKLNLLQSLQEIGIGMEVLHEVALPYKRRLMGDEEEELPTQDALSLPLDDEGHLHLHQQQTTTTMPLEEKERLERAAGEINEDHPLDQKTSDSAQAMARMQLLCAALRARLTPVDKSSDEWKVIVRLMSTSSVKVLDAFEVEREGEKERFQPFAALPNRSLLCHGTGVYNILGILRKGMCIAPKEANGSGTNFGKGLYFADFPEKSVGYMSSDHGKGCFFLCDVALGEPLVRTSTGFRQPLPPGRHHCWGVGRVITHPEAVLYTDGGLRIPMGEDKRAKGGMGHNEFIVYNEGQVRIRYLLLVQEGA